MAFETIIGNDNIKEILSKSVMQHQVTHSYLFVGPSGIGKTLFAKEFAKMLTCLSEQKPCGTCRSCLQWEENNQPDVIQIEPQEGSIKINAIRAMQMKVLEKPIVSLRKIYLIKDADFMTKEAQNCLLKTLEEPPSYVTILLIASSESLLLNTIRSRCMKLSFHPIEDHVLKNYLQQKQGMGEISKNMLALFEGSIEKAIKIQEKKEVYETIERVFSQVERYTLLEAMKALEVLYQNKEIAQDVLDGILVILMRQAIQKPEYVRYIEIVETAKQNIKGNSNYDMCIDQLLFQIWEESI